MLHPRTSRVTLNHTAPINTTVNMITLAGVSEQRLEQLVSEPTPNFRFVCSSFVGGRL